MKTITLYDNKAKGRFKANWGFSCLVQLKNRNILFDTGGDEETLGHNANLLGIDKNSIDYCFISHLHGDHTGGLSWLSKNTNVFLPGEYKNGIKEIDAIVFNHLIREQTVIVKPSKIMLVGCSHPGIVRMAEAVYKKYGRLNLIIGGFHLMSSSEKELMQIANRLKEVTERIAPCHCTGEESIEIFRNVFKERFVENYAGKII